MTERSPESPRALVPREARIQGVYFALSRLTAANHPDFGAFLEEALRQLAHACDLSEVGYWWLEAGGKRARLELQVPASGHPAKPALASMELGWRAERFAQGAALGWTDPDAGSPQSAVAIPVQAGGSQVGFLLLQMGASPGLTTAEQRWLVEIGELVGAHDLGGTQGIATHDERSTTCRAQLGLMAGGIAHDLNNLLVGIYGGLELAFEGVQPSSSLYSNLDLIQESARRATRLSRSLLAFAGGRRALLETLELNEWLRHEALQCASQSSDCVPLFDFETPAIDVQADRETLQRIVASLFSNSINASAGSDKTIRLRTGTVDPAQVAAQTDWVLRPAAGDHPFYFIEVTDHGHGIPRHVLGRVFDPFFTTRMGGSGLGLAAVLGLVEGQAGGITIASEVGFGTTVRILLPLLTVTPNLSAAHSSTVGTSGLALIVDDDLSVLNTIARMLNSHGYDTLTASRADAALQMLKSGEHDVDVILLDVEMPGMDGFEALRRVREIRPDLPAVLICGFSDRVDLDLQESAPFLQKPFTSQQLLALLPVPRANDRP